VVCALFCAYAPVMNSISIHLRIEVGRRCGLFADFADYLRITAIIAAYLPLIFRLIADILPPYCRHIAAKLPNGLIYSLT